MCVMIPRRQWLYVQLFFVGFFTLAVLSLTFIKHQQR